MKGGGWFGKPELQLKAGHATIMRKWKWLFVKGCEYGNKFSSRCDI
jgi:hypothetical protein